MPNEQTLEDILLKENAQAAEAAAREEREKTLWERLNRGPRERADELTARGWQDRYGVNEGSGKLAKIFAGLGEMGRSVALGRGYRGIQDEARENALKEYQAEVGPLQRELGVISAERRAANALQENMALQREKLEQKKYVDARNQGRSDEELILKGDFTRAKIDQIKSSIGLTEARTALTAGQTNAVNQRNQMLERFGGIAPAGATAEAAAIDFLGRKDPAAGTDLFNLRQALRGAGKGGSGSSAGGGTTTVSNRQVYMKTGTGPDGADILEPKTLTTTTSRIPAGGGTAATSPPPLPAWVQLSQANPKNAKVQEAAKKLGSEEPSVTFRLPGDKVVVAAPNPSAPQPKPRATVQGGRVVAAPAVDPAITQAIKRYFPNADPASPDFVPQKLRGPQTILVAKRPKTPQEEAVEKATLEGLRVAKTGLDEFMSGDLELEVGLLGKPLEWGRDVLNKKKSSPLFLETRSVQALNSYLNAISGLAVTKAEEIRAKRILPTTGDQPRTLMLKAFQGMQIEAQHKWLKGAGVPTSSQAELFEKNPDLISAPNVSSSIALQHMDAARKARRTGQKTYRIPMKNGGYKDYQTGKVEDFVWALLTSVTEDMEEAFIRTFPDGLGIGPTSAAYKRKGQ